jgi:hypothetical protein
MARFIDDRRPAPMAGGHVDGDADALANRALAEMQSAVGSLRARLPDAFPRWQQRRNDAARGATTDRRE